MSGRRTDPDPRLAGMSSLSIKDNATQRQHSSSIAAVRPSKLETLSAGTPTAGPLDSPAAVSPLKPPEVLLPLGTVPPSPHMAATADRPLVPSLLSPRTTVPGSAVVTTSSPDAVVRATAAPQTLTPRKQHKPAPNDAPPTSTLHQQLQQIHSSSEAVQQQLIAPADLPASFAISTLMQPGPLFLDSFSDTALDSATTLPHFRHATRHSKHSAAVPMARAHSNASELWKLNRAHSDASEMWKSTGAHSDASDMWKSTTWGQGTAYSFGLEALGSLSTAIGTPGCQLAVLTLSHVDLGDGKMQQLCTGISRCG